VPNSESTNEAKRHRELAPTATSAAPAIEGLFARIVRSPNDVVGLVALANVIIASYRQNESLDISRLVEQMSPDAIEVFRSSAVPALGAHNEEVLKLSAINESSRISDHPMYLRLAEDQESAVTNITAQIQSLDKLVRDRTNLYVQLGVGVAASIVLGLFVLLAQKIAPTTVFYTPVAAENLPNSK